MLMARSVLRRMPSQSSRKYQGAGIGAVSPATPVDGEDTQMRVLPTAPGDLYMNGAVVRGRK
jgi:hypothetical protein